MGLRSPVAGTRCQPLVWTGPTSLKSAILVVIVVRLNPVVFSRRITFVRKPIRLVEPHAKINLLASLAAKRHMLGL